MAGVKIKPASRKTAKHKTGKKSVIKTLKRELSASHNEFKEFEGKQYSGMKIGRSHNWYYDKGEWRETTNDGPA